MNALALWAILALLFVAGLGLAIYGLARQKNRIRSQYLSLVLTEKLGRVVRIQLVNVETLSSLPNMLAQEGSLLATWVLRSAVRPQTDGGFRVDLMARGRHHGSTANCLLVCYDREHTEWSFAVFGCEDMGRAVTWPQKGSPIRHIGNFEVGLLEK